MTNHRSSARSTSRSYVPRHSATCTRCRRETVCPPSESVIRLGVACLAEVSPGRDVDAYTRLVSTYGYAR